MMAVLDTSDELASLRNTIERFTRGELDVDSLRSRVDAMIDRWRAARKSDKPPLAEVEGRLWHVVWQIEAACSQELAPDGALVYLAVLDGQLPAPEATERLRP